MADWKRAQEGGGRGQEAGPVAVRRRGGGPAPSTRNLQHSSHIQLRFDIFTSGGFVTKFILASI